MSATQAQDKAERLAVMRSADPEMTFAEDSLGRTFGLKTLGPAAMLNVIEMAGGKASENTIWLKMAMMLSGVVSIDGVPVPEPKTKEAFLKFADKVGNEGLIAISDASTGTVGGEDQATVAAFTREAELAASRSSSSPTLP